MASDLRPSTDTARRAFLKGLASVAVIACGARASAGSIPAVSSPAGSLRTAWREAADILDIPKIDIHTHISTDAVYLREVMDALNLKMFTICNEGLKVERLDAQLESARRITAHYPRYYDWATTFGFGGMVDGDWADRVTTQLAKDFVDGALAVKVWKEIGMQVRDPNGRLVQIDDPIFEPILDFIATQDKTLFAHIGDPVHRWVSFDEEFRRDGWYREGAGVNNRVGMFRGEVSYDDMMLARDRMVAAHPHLRVVACHMASMPFDVDLVADRLDRFPNLAVETSSVIRHLMAQARGKVRTFLLEYQDRVIYGADISGGLIPTPYLIDMSKFDARMNDAEITREKRDLLRRYRRDFTYYATDRTLEAGGYTVKGLNLPRSVLRKLFYENAVRWVPGVDRSFRPQDR